MLNVDFPYPTDPRITLIVNFSFVNMVNRSSGIYILSNEYRLSFLLIIKTVLEKLVKRYLFLLYRHHTQLKYPLSVVPMVENLELMVNQMEQAVGPVWTAAETTERNPLLLLMLLAYSEQLQHPTRYLFGNKLSKYEKLIYEGYPSIITFVALAIHMTFSMITSQNYSFAGVIKLYWYVFDFC